jgi:photosystem II stability/assembly factor-like uncharacterized protein
MTPYNGSYFGMLCLKGGELLIFGLRGNAYRSADQGNTWEQSKTGVSLAIMDGIETADGKVY